MFTPDLFQPRDLIFDLDCQNKKAVITTLVNLLNDNYSLTKTPKVWIEEFMKRESKGSTGLQNGIAVPHIKIHDVDRLYSAIGLHHQGMNFNSIDGKSTHIIFLLIAPFSQAQTHLHFLSMMSRIFLQKDFTERVLQIKSPESVCNFFKEMFYESS